MKKYNGGVLIINTIIALPYGHKDDGDANLGLRYNVDSSRIHRGELLLDDTVVDANDLITTGRNNFKDWQCWAGVDQLNVAIGGAVYRADCQWGGDIGTIRDFTLPQSPIKCGRDTCSCLSDIYIRKAE